MKVPTETIDRVRVALAAAHPDQYPGSLPDFDLLLSRILWARYLSPAAEFRAGREDDWWGGRWIHACTRDRRNEAELIALWDAGIREYNGLPIMGSRSDPYVRRWSREDVREVWMDIDALPDLEELMGERSP